MLSLNLAKPVLERIEKFEKRIFSVRHNWDMFRPYLNSGEAIESLKECLGYEKQDRWNPVTDEPWERAIDTWYRIIDERIDNDPAYQSRLHTVASILFPDKESLNDVAWEEVYTSDEYLRMYSRFHVKHRPRHGEFEWYQWFHGCFYIAPFIATLLKAAIHDAEAVLVLTSDTYSIACFVRDNALYYADNLVDWYSVSDLENFMGQVNQIKFL